MIDDLSFGLGEKTEIPAIPDQAGDRADSERTGVPHRIQSAGVAVELLQPRLRPGQMIVFFVGRLRKFLLNIGVTRSQGLSLIERLRTYLSTVIHSHQPAG